jgi:cobalt-zinc-cadmium efflux system outer membrane protein
MHPPLLGLLLAAPALHLSTLLAEAREKNPDLRAAEAQVRAAQSSIEPAAALDDPMLMLQLWNAPADFSTVPIMLQVSQAFPLGGKLSARRSSATADADVSRANLAARQRDVEADVERAWFDLFLATRTIDIDAEIGRTLAGMRDAANARVAAGTGDTVDELKAEGEILRLSADRETAEAQRAAANARLAVLVQRDPSEPLGVPATPAPLATIPPEAVLREKALASRAELKAAEAMIASADAQRRLAQAARIPDIGVNLAAMYQFGGTGEHTFLFAGVQGNLPVFGRSKLQPRIDAAGAQIDALREMEGALRNRIFADIATAYAEVTAEARLVALHHELVPLARRTLESALSSYSAGRGSFLTVLDSERELQMHGVDQASHLATYEQRLVDLQRAVGADLGLVDAAERGAEETHGGHR